MKITKLLVAALLLVVSSLCFYGCEGEPEPKEPKLDEFQFVLTNAEWGLNYTSDIIKTRSSGSTTVYEEWVFDYDGEEHIIGGYVLRNGKDTLVRVYCIDKYNHETQEKIEGEFKEKGTYSGVIVTEYLMSSSSLPVLIEMRIIFTIK